MAESEGETARRILREQHYCVVATATRMGQPWVSPVYFNVDDSYKLVWESARDSRHSVLIAENPRVAIVVANFSRQESDEALYLECEAAEVPPSGLEAALGVYLNGWHRRGRSREHKIGDYLDGEPLRLYEAVPQISYLMVVTYDAQGRRIDKRHEVHLSET
jgi:hypothetical protein